MQPVRNMLRRWCDSVRVSHRAFNFRYVHTQATAAAYDFFVLDSLMLSACLEQPSE